MFKEIPEGQCSIIVVPNFDAMIFGISQIKQNNKGEIAVRDSAWNEYELGVVLDAGSTIDIQEMHAQDKVNYLISRLAPLCI